MTAPVAATASPFTPDTSSPRPSDAVVYRALPDGGVLFSTTTEEYFGLNETSAFIWEQLATCATVSELCAAVSARFPDAPADAIAADVGELLTMLVTAGLAAPRA